MRRANTKLLRRGRTRRRARGTTERPRLSVFRSNRYLSAQIIDDSRGVTLASASERELIRAKTKKKSAAQNRTERARLVGEKLAERATANGIRQTRFDRGSYRYHGLVAALAAGARKGGLKF